MASRTAPRMPARPAAGSATGAGSAGEGRAGQRVLLVLLHSVLRVVVHCVLLAPSLAMLWGDAAVQAQQPGAAFRADAVLRPGHHQAWRSDRDGSTSERHDFRMRVQLGGWWLPDPAWAVRLRVAGRLSTEQQTVSFRIQDHVPAADGLPHGVLTLDEAYVRWRPGDHLQIRAGRMQTSFELAGVPRKSLDRNDSPNTDVTWTDGVHASLRIREGWRQHLVVQRHGDDGPTNAIRRPLDVTGGGSPIMVFAATQFERRLGPFIQREIDISYLPRTVTAPANNEARGDYVALVVRGAVEPGVTVGGGRLVLGTEVGIASGAPSRAVLGTGSSANSADPWAFQLSANLMEMGRRHSVGILHSQAGDGWLISPDVRDNNREAEARYYWQYAPWGRLDARIRYREDMRLRVGSPHRRQDHDLYVRTTLRF
jgi:hypothetical protein